MSLRPTDEYVNTTAPDADYPDGSAKNEVSAGSLDGTPWEKAGIDDLYGFQQTLTNAAGIVPSGNPETVNASQHWQGLLHAASAGRYLKEAAGSAADVYVLEPVGNNLIPGLYSENLELSFVVVNTNTGGPATIEVDDGVNPSLGIINIKKDGGDLAAGDWTTGDTVTVSFRPGLPSFEWTGTSNFINATLQQLISNIFIDPSCISAQDITNTFNLSTSVQYGQVDDVLVSATGTVGAGTITQVSSANTGQTGFACKAAGVTLSAGSETVIFEKRVPSSVAKQFKNKTMSFQVSVFHDIGLAKDFTIKLKKPTAEDDWTVDSTIATSPATSVGDATETPVKFENQAVGDISNGFSIEVTADTGAITTKNIEITDFSGVVNAIAIDVPPYNFDEHYAVLRRRVKFFLYSDATSERIAPGMVSTTNSHHAVFPTPDMLSAPAVSS